MKIASDRVADDETGGNTMKDGRDCIWAVCVDL